MGFLFSRPTRPTPTSPPPLPTLLLARAAFVGQPLAQVLETLRARGIETLPIPLKSRDTWTPPPRRSTGRVIVIYSADTLHVQTVVYE
jgi:hypothetical protein